MVKFEESFRFGAGRYIQGEAVLDECGTEIKRYGKHAYVIGGPTALSLVSERARTSMEKSGVDAVWETYAGYPTTEKIEELSNTIVEQNCDVVVGVGGGRIADLSKAAAMKAGISIVMIPTSAATCASYSPLSVLYKADGKSDTYMHLEYEVNAVIVDEQIMLTQPVKLLRAGILDAMAKYIEIGMGNSESLAGDTDISKHSAYHLAKYSYEVLRDIGTKAVQDLEKKCWSKELHEVVYTNIALTGIVSAMTRGEGQTAIAHAFNNTLHRLFIEKVHPYLHGEVVGMGMLAQLVYNEDKSRLEEVKQCLKAYHNPISIRELGIEPTEENQEQIVKMLYGQTFMVQDSEHEILLKQAVREVSE